MVGCIHGGASLPPSNGAYKRFVRELNAVISTPPKPLEWSVQVITFDPEDHPANTARVGTLPLIVSPVIHNYKVTKMLVDGGSSLNLLTAKVLSTLQIPLSRPQDTGAFQGMNGNVTCPLGKIDLPVTFGDHVGNIRSASPLGAGPPGSLLAVGQQLPEPAQILVQRLDLGQ